MRATPDNALRLLEVLAAFGFAELGVEAHDLTAANQVVQLGRPPNRIDLLTSISGVDFDAAWDGRVPAELEGESVAFLGWKELLQNKRASGREKDRADVEQLLAVAARSGKE